MIVFAFDDLAITRQSNLCLVSGPVEKLGVVNEADRASDLDSIISFASTIVAVDGGWRMYYSCRQLSLKHMLPRYYYD